MKGHSLQVRFFLLKDDTLGSDNGARSGKAYSPIKGFQLATPKPIPLLRWRRFTPYPRLSEPCRERTTLVHSLCLFDLFENLTYNLGFVNSKVIKS